MLRDRIMLMSSVLTVSSFLPAGLLTRRDPPLRCWSRASKARGALTALKTFGDLQRGESVELVGTFSFSQSLKNMTSEQFTDCKFHPLQFLVRVVRTIKCPWKGTPSF